MSQPKSSATTGSLHVPVHPVRFVTAASLFDGHDAAINIMRRILQSQGAEVIHLGHNRVGRRGRRPRRSRRTCRASRSAPTRAATSSTSTTWSTCCASAAPAHIQVFGGGGGVIVAGRDRRAAAPRGVAASSRPQDGQRLGLPGMINELIARVRRRPRGRATRSLDALLAGRRTARARPGDHRARGGPVRRRARRDARAPRPRHAQRAGARHHRHRRLGQVLAHRRAGPPLPAATRTTSCASPSSRSTRPAAEAAARCSATASG